MIRLPKQFVDVDQLNAVVGDSDYSSVIDAGENVILDLVCSEVEPDDYFVDGSEWMDRPKPLRADLLAGDLRLLYLVWLIGVEDGMYEDYEDEDDGSESEALEPLPGIRPLTPQLKASIRTFVKPTKPSDVRKPQTVEELLSRAETLRERRENRR